MTILKITVSKVVDITDPLVYTPDAIHSFLNENYWNDAVLAPEVFDEIRREIIECAFISELRVEKVEVIEDANSSGTIDGISWSDAGAPG